jgi:hypothetical protein
LKFCSAWRGAVAGNAQRRTYSKLGAKMCRTEIEEAIFSNVTARWQKVALIIVKVADESGVSFADDEDDFEVIANHIEQLVSEGRLSAQGDLNNWRSSEIRKLSET